MSSLRLAFSMFLVAAGLAAAASAAAAQPVAVASEAAPPRLTLGAGALLVLPQGDADEFSDESLGARLAFTYGFTPWVAGVASFEYVAVNENDDAEDYDADFTYYAIDLGVRVSPPWQDRLRPIGEFLLGRHTVRYDVPGDEGSESDLGIRLGGGIATPIGGGADFTALLSYASAEIEEADIESMQLEGGVTWSF